VSDDDSGASCLQFVACLKSFHDLLNCAELSCNNEMGWWAVPTFAQANHLHIEQGRHARLERDGGLEQRALPQRALAHATAALPLGGAGGAGAVRTIMRLAR